MKVSSSVKTALIILGVLVLAFGVRNLFPRAGEVSGPEIEEERFSVLVEEIAPQPWRDEVLIRGRTQALRKVIVRAETSGVVEATLADPGAMVDAGDVLCKLKIDARRAALAEAKAALAKAQLDFDAAMTLAEEGFRAETGVAAARAARDLARANLEQATLSVEKTKITAPFGGVFDDRLVEIGDYMNVGDPCGVLIQQTPFLVVGAISEQEVGKIKKGDHGLARLSTGETIEGVVRFVAVASDAATRTFDVELEIPNEDGRLRDGVTADFIVFTSERNAHLVQRSALTLDDKGRIGVRLVGAGDIVEFRTVKLLGESDEGVWVAGLDGRVQVITRGQDFVTEGQHVAVTTRGRPS